MFGIIVVNDQLRLPLSIQVLYYWRDSDLYSILQDSIISIEGNDMIVWPVVLCGDLLLTYLSVCYSDDLLLFIDDDVLWLMMTVGIYANIIEAIIYCYSGRTSLIDQPLLFNTDYILTLFWPSLLNQYYEMI